jgi:hypothetical protein|tara:strand:- start:388 stop:579 length:192 start_codon:yes stop_codon:yes gene_type:complete
MSDKTENWEPGVVQAQDDKPEEADLPAPQIVERIVYVERKKAAETGFWGFFWGMLFGSFFLGC